MKVIEKIREVQPLVHSITNYVTSNDVANMILAIGAKPIMAEYVNEVAEIVSLSKALNLNMGMITDVKLEAMLAAGSAANKYNIPIVLDPVGCGSTQFRRDALDTLLTHIHFTVIKANASEMMTIVKRSHLTIGVDADVLDIDSVQSHLKEYTRLSSKLDTILVITGKKDYVIDHDDVYIIDNGHPMMSKVTGTGCMLNGLISAFIAVQSNKESVLEAVLTMGVAGEIAYEHLEANQGNISYRNYIIDAVSLMDDTTIQLRGHYESQKITS